MKKLKNADSLGGLTKAGGDERLWVSVESSQHTVTMACLPNRFSIPDGCFLYVRGFPFTSVQEALRESLDGRDRACVRSGCVLKSINLNPMLFEKLPS